MTPAASVDEPAPGADPGGVPGAAATFIGNFSADPPHAVAGDGAGPRRQAAGCCRARASATLAVAGAALLLLIGSVALVMAWRAQTRLRNLEQELVRRQQDSQNQSAEARVLAREAQDGSRDSAARLALLEARLAEVTSQRGQFEELLQALTRSRDENLLVDIDSGIRVALQQSAITGSAEPLVAALKQADERLQRHNQPRLEGVRRAIARDLDRARAAASADLPTLGIKLDEAVRMVDELPLLSTAAPRREAALNAGAPAAAAQPPAAPSAGSVDTLAIGEMPAWLAALDGAWAAASERVATELRSLLRVTRIDRPEAALMAPENAFFVRENLKLRLLNARLALLSRQYDTAQSDLAWAQTSLERWFDRNSRRTLLTQELLRQVAALARQISVPRPDDTLAALAAVKPGGSRSLSTAAARARPPLPMRAVIWFVLLFAVAVVAATTLGTNDGLVSVYWSGWRLDASLNLFLLALIGTCFALVSLIQAASALTALPRRAREWRVARRDRSAQAALREALAQYFGGRYSRAQSAAQRALAIQVDTPELAQDNEFTVLGHLLAAGSAHRLQDRARRDEQLQRALELARRSPAARSAEEGARLLSAEWALDDRDAPRALSLLAELPPGVARRTHALRLKLSATRLGQQPHEALRTARLLTKHQGLSKVAGQGLLRSLAFECIDGARDIDQLRRIWLQLDAADRRDPFVAARAASAAAAHGAFDDARGWLRPFWERLSDLPSDERAVLALALVDAVQGIGADWLPRLEAAASAYPREPAVAYAVGNALAERQLWGKAQHLLETASVDGGLHVDARRGAYQALARLAEQKGDAEGTARLHLLAARLR